MTERARVYLRESCRPTVRGLSSLLGVSTRTLYTWSQDHSEFGVVFGAILEKRG